MNIESICNDSLFSRKFLIKTGTVIQKGMLLPESCGCLGIDKGSHIKIINYAIIQ